MSGLPDFVDALRAEIAGAVDAPVYAQMPNPRPASFVYLDRSGGPLTLSSDSPVITFEAWAPSKQRAYLLAQRLREHVMRHLPPLVGGIRVVSRREVAGLSYQPPAVSGAFRYRVTVQFKHQLSQEKP
ncbi:hypothetical protein [Actinomyces faecalis]|uniref:hypothetical protein n=1 Tax=Actinomyces faecalis TaxID=2722820 RepID=UPI001556886E|nr:hypothetical protein [Actinomyces faecalis]